MVEDGHKQFGLGGLHAGPGLVDFLLDVIFGENHRRLRLRSSRDRRLEGPPGDLDLDRDLVSQAGKVGLLPDEFPPRGLQPRCGQIHLVAVGDRVDLRQHLAAFDPIALVDEKADDVARNDLWREVDNVGLDESVVGNRERGAALPPAEDDQKSNGRQRDRHDHSEDIPIPGRPNANVLWTGRGNDCRLRRAHARRRLRERRAHR